MKLIKTVNELNRGARNNENENWNRLEKLSKEVNDLVLESGGDSNLEVVQARGGKPVLNDRLNSIDAQLADKATYEYVDKELQGVSLSYKESYQTVSDLYNQYPNGDINNHVVLDDEYIYTWHNDDWISTGIKANGTGIAPHSVSYHHTNFISGGNLFNGVFSSLFVDSNTNEIKLDTSGVVKSSIVEIRSNERIFIQTKGTHNRFIISLTNTKDVGNSGKHLKIERNSEGNEQFEFLNSDGYKYLFVTVSSLSQEPLVMVYNRKGLNISGKEILSQDSENFIEKKHLKDFIIDISKLEDGTYDKLNTLPKTRSNLALWLKADSLNLDDGEKVGVWDDLSGNNESVVQINESKQPTFTEDAYNGMPCVRFISDSKNLMSLASLRSLFKRRKAVTIITVAKTNSVGESGRIMYVSGSESSAITRLRFGEHNRMYDAGARTLDSEQYIHPARVQEGYNIDTVNPRIQRAEFDWASGKIDLFINGEEVASNTHLIKGASEDTEPRAFYLGGSNVDGQFFDGDVMEVLIYDGVLEDGEVSRIESYLSEKWDINLFSGIENKLELSTKYNLSNNLNEIDTSTLMLYGIKQVNGHRLKQPETVGYLWADDRNVYYSSSVSETPEFLFRSTEEYTLTYYKPVICRNGDVILVKRGELFPDSPRENPVIYKAPNYERIEVVLDVKQPTGWLQNCGMDYFYADEAESDYFIFSEYTRAHHSTAKAWKVSYPFDDPDSWKVVMEVSAGSDLTEIEHFHTASLDPYSGNWLVTSGDDDEQCINWISTDQGNSWVKIAGGGQKYRLLNYIFTEDFVYWAVDYLDHTHALYRAERVDGIPDLVNAELLGNLPRGQSTYGLVYLPSKNGLLILDRAERRLDLTLDVFYYSIKDEKLSRIDQFQGLEDSDGFFGFRMSALTMYPNLEDNAVICGFENTNPNMLNVLGNVGDIKTIVLRY